MTIEKITTVDQIEITKAGNVQARFGLLLVENGIEIDRKWHRRSISPGGDVDAQMAAVNANLASMGKSPVDAIGIGRIKTLAQSAWTPDVLAQAHGS